MTKKILISILFLYSILLGKAKVENEIIEGNKLKLTFTSSLIYSLEKKGNKSFFVIPDFQDESAPGDVSLPSNEIFISLPYLTQPKVSFKIHTKKTISAIPKFNDKVELMDGELIYSKPDNLKNSKKEHFKIKGYLWIGNSYCMQVEFTPAIFKATDNIIELVDNFEIELIFDKNIFSDGKLKKQSDKKSIIANANFTLNNIKQKFPVAASDTWIDYSKDYVKIGTARDGIYRITKSDLENLGVNVSALNPKSFRLFLKGEELPIFVEGESDLSFDSNDYLEFVGIRNMGGHHRELSGYDLPYNEYLGRYTDTTVYWLTWGGDDGKRVEILAGNELTSSDTLEYYSQIEHYEKNNWFDFSCGSQVRRESPFWIENKTWVEGVLRGGKKVSKNFVLSNIYPNKTATILAKLQDYAANLSKKAHLLAIGINNDGNYYDSTYINKYDKIVLSANINSSSLKEGKNSLQVYSFVTDASLNACATDWYEIEYPRYLKPVNDSLNFTFPFLSAEEIKVIKLQDVSTNNFVIWKYGNNYKKYLPSKINGNILIADTLSATSKFCFVDKVKIKTPKLYYIKKFINLRSSENQADYIAVTHKKFKNETEKYCRFISSNYNIVTKVVDINDIYDEYGYGFFNPEVIKDFLKSTHNNWKMPKPQSVVLIGGATYDYYGNKYKNFSSVKNRVLNYVPSFGAPVSDNWFVTWDTTGAYVPQMNIGRIPVTTNEEFVWYFDKHKDYVSQAYDDWNKKYLFFSGGNENKPAELNSMRQSNQYVVDNYVIPKPISGKAVHFYKTLEPPTNFGPYTHEFIQNTINEGAVFISYLGHSGTQTWDNSITNPAQLKNNIGRYPIVSDFGCSTGRFAEPDVTSFSELFTVGSNGQALGYIGNASLGFTTTSLLMPKLFYKKILKESIHTVSLAHKEAKLEMLQKYGSVGIYKLFALTNTFIGDPVLTLPVPTKPNFVVKGEGIETESELLTDIMDSTSISVIINNYGTVTDDTLTILAIHKYNSETDSIISKIMVPEFVDTITIKVPIKKKAGNHLIQVILDPSDKFEEIYKDDNTAQIRFNVASSSIRPLLNTRFFNGVKDSLVFINPSSKPNIETIIFEISTDENFTEVENFEIPFDTIITSIDIAANLKENKRYWGRTKIKGENNYSTTFSFFTNKDKYSLTDDFSFSRQNLKNINVINNNLQIDSTIIRFKIFSAGLSDGNTALIMKNGTNYMFDGTLRGHYVTTFKDSTYEFVESKVFDLLGGGSTVAEQYSTFLDTVPSNYLVMFAIKDEGATNLNSTLRNKIKGFGSVLIDNVKFRSSWAFIGKRGAVPGTMPEAVSAEGDGPVTIDTTISFLSDTGNILTTEVGPAGKWNKLILNQETPSNSKITYTPLGIKKNGTIDTLAQLVLQDSVSDLSFINSDIYPKIKILADFNASDNKQSPVLKYLGIDYDNIPEFALNYQAASVKYDSIMQGGKNRLYFNLYNIGETKADSVPVKIELQKSDNSSVILNEFVTTVDSLRIKKFNFQFDIPSSYGYGNMAFAITIDGTNIIPEFFEDNNFYRVPFYVKKDTSTNIVSAKLNVKFDGFDILDGDFVADKPQVTFELNYSGNFPYDDTTVVKFILDNKTIAYSEMNVDYDTINSIISYQYEPELNNGKHYLKATRKPLYVGDTGETLYEKLFTVSDELKAVDIYNYPNPASEETNFTFRLAKVPESLDIRIYTVAGRLVKIFKLKNYDLKADINKIYWDLTDEDGDKIANGVYLYKITLRSGNKIEHYTEKLAIVR